jgi:hypothetical protein
MRREPYYINVNKLEKMQCVTNGRIATLRTMKALNHGWGVIHKSHAKESVSAGGM